MAEIILVSVNYNAKLCGASMSHDKKITSGYTSRCRLPDGHDGLCMRQDGTRIIIHTNALRPSGVVAARMPIGKHTAHNEALRDAMTDNDFAALVAAALDSNLSTHTTQGE